MKLSANPPSSFVRYRQTVRTGLFFGFFLLLSVTAFGDSKKALRQAQKALRSGDFQRAEQLYREILQKDDYDREAHLGLSRTLLKQRRLQESFDHAARVVAVDPLSAPAHALLGSAILAAGDFRLSLEEFRTALTLDDDQPMAIAGLAMIDFYENRNIAAVEKLRRAVSMDPGEPDYIFSLGQAAARSERYKEAADAYERFLLIAPRTDADRRARIRGLIDFLLYLGQQSSLYTVSGPERTVLSFESIDNRPIVKIRINGSKTPLRFVLDTGSGMSVVSDETARKLGLKPVARGGLARAIGGGGRFDIIYGYLNSIDLGDIHIENVPVYIRRFYDTTTHVDGYLGIAALSRLVTAVDYGSRRMTLVRQRDSADLGSLIDQIATSGTSKIVARPGIEIPVRTTSSGFLSGEVTIEGIKKSLNFIIDTGATVSVISERAAELDAAAEFIQPDRMRVFGAAGIAEDVKMALLPRVAIGSCAREKINAAVLDLEPINETAGFQQNGILGGNFLRHFRIVFDFQRAIVRLEPLDGIKSASPTIPQETTGL
ncbi:MAG TPA: aspartyl protease family protein [Pyrinomonadaceae bacterium]